jgi:WD40 repeat protein
VLPNQVIVSGDEGGEVRVWNGVDGKQIKTLSGGGTSAVKSLVGDGKRIVSGNRVGVIHVFALESGACTEVLFQAPDRVDCLLLRGDVLVAGCDDGKVRAWDLSIGSGSLREFEDDMDEAVNFRAAGRRALVQ